MKAFMTKGTADFLKKIAEKHSDIQIHLMTNSNGALAYYEHPRSKIFQSGMAYDMLGQIGDVEETGYVVMNNIPVREESQSIFEDRFKGRMGEVETFAGFQSVRLLRPTRGNTYIVFTQWSTKKDFDNWKDSPEFAAAHSKNIIKPSDFFAERPFISTYNMYTEEDEAK
jgi:heme-degrading monooxygenase HmoA